MALPLRSLTTAQRASYDAALVASHRVSVDVMVYDQNEDPLEPFGGTIVAGQVDADLGNDITRTLSLEVVDRAEKFTFDDLGTVAPNRYLGVEYHVWVEALSDWVAVPVFYGPVSYFARNGKSVTVEAVSKEALLLPPVRPNTPDIPASRDLSSWLRACAATHGEERFGEGFRSDDKRLPKAWVPQPANEVGLWPVMLGAADDFNRQLFYNARGFLDLRRWPEGRDAWLFDEDSVLTLPAVSYDLREALNTVRVYGADKKGHAILRAEATLQDAHPLSAASLARNGSKRVLLETVKTDNPKLGPADARKMARRILDNRSSGALSVSFESLVVPHLEPGDIVRVETPYYAGAFRLRAFSVPLTAGGTMSIGRTGAASLKQLRRTSS